VEEDVAMWQENFGEGLVEDVAWKEKKRKGGKNKKENRKKEK
jgi:hypothetical protein